MIMYSSYSKMSPHRTTASMLTGNRKGGHLDRTFPASVSIFSRKNSDPWNEKKVDMVLFRLFRMDVGRYLIGIGTEKYQKIPKITEESDNREVMKLWAAVRAFIFSSYL